MEKKFENFVRVFVLVLFFIFVVAATPLMITDEIDVPVTLAIMGLFGLVVAFYHSIMD